MRGGRSLLILLVLALGLGAYIYFVEMERDPSGTETLEKVFAVEEASAINWIQVQPAGGETTTLEKAGEAWRIVAPVTADADEPAVTAIADALASIDIVTVLDENPTNLAQYGLDPAQASVAFRTEGDATERRLKIGNRTPTGSDIYAQVEGEPRLLLVAAYREDTLNRSTFELRDKGVLNFARTEVDSVSLDPATGPEIAMVREVGDWKLTNPVDARADMSAVDSLIGRLDTAQISTIVQEGDEPTLAELRTFGLDQPRVVATVGAGSTRAALAIGRDADETTVYARDLSRPLVFTVEKSLLTDLQKQPADLRVRDVFSFTTYSANALQVSSNGSTREYTKSAPAVETAPEGEAPADGDAAGGAPPVQPAEVWRQTAPVPTDVNQTAMTDLLNTLSSLRADSFTERVPTTGDGTTVVVRSGDSSQEERVTLRTTGDTAYAIVEGEPGAAVIPTEDFDRVMGQLQALAGG